MQEPGTTLPSGGGGCGKWHPTPTLGRDEPQKVHARNTQPPGVKAGCPHLPPSGKKPPAPPALFQQWTECQLWSPSPKWGHGFNSHSFQFSHLTENSKGRMWGEGQEPPVAIDATAPQGAPWAAPFTREEVKFRAPSSRPPVEGEQPAQREREKPRRGL